MHRFVSCSWLLPPAEGRIKERKEERKEEEVVEDIKGVMNAVSSTTKYLKHSIKPSVQTPTKRSAALPTAQSAPTIQWGRWPTNAARPPSTGRSLSVKMRLSRQETAMFMVEVFKGTVATLTLVRRNVVMDPFHKMLKTVLLWQVYNSEKNVVNHLRQAVTRCLSNPAPRNLSLCRNVSQEESVARIKIIITEISRQRLNEFFVTQIGSQWYKYRWHMVQ